MEQLSCDCAARRRVNLVGQEIASTEDLAVLAQVYRDPRFETMRVIFTDAKNQIVTTMGLTSRMPGAWAIVVGADIHAYLERLSGTAAKHKADQYRRALAIRQRRKTRRSSTHQMPTIFATLS